MLVRTHLALPVVLCLSLAPAVAEACGGCFDRSMLLRAWWVDAATGLLGGLVLDALVFSALRLMKGLPVPSTPWSLRIAAAVLFVSLTVLTMFSAFVMAMTVVLVLGLRMGRWLVTPPRPAWRWVAFRLVTVAVVLVPAIVASWPARRSTDALVLEATAFLHGAPAAEFPANWIERELRGRSDALEVIERQLRERSHSRSTPRLLELHRALGGEQLPSTESGTALGGLGAPRGAEGH